MASLENKLRGLPRVRSVGVAMSLPPDLLVMSNNYTVEGATPNAAGPSDVAEWNVVNSDYFATMGIRVLRGRAFDSRDRANSTSVAVVNEAFVRRHFPGGDALGRRLKAGDWDPTPKSPWITVVGVVKDVPYRTALGVDPIQWCTLPIRKTWAAGPVHCHGVQRESCGPCTRCEGNRGVAGFTRAAARCRHDERSRAPVDGRTEISWTPFLGTRCAGPAAGCDRYLRRDGVPRQPAPP